MVPPTEQLVRDYLNRLSVAARGQLDPDDRRALVDRTRDFIERKTGRAGQPTAMEVGKLLSGLGDPSTLVQQERQRLAAIRGELPDPPASRNPITKALRRDSGKARGARHWPVTAGQTDLQLTLLDGGAGRNGSDATTSGGAGGTGSNETASDVTPSEDDRAANGEPGPYVPAQPSDRDWFFRALGAGRSKSGSQSDEAPAMSGADEPSPHPDERSQMTPPWPLAGAGGADSDASNVSGAEYGTSASRTVGPAWPPTTQREPMLPPQLRRAMSAAVTWYRRRPLEASAVVLLGVGGAIYPPVWLAGAVVALPSRVWDGRDKWLGLALPLLLTIIAAAFGVSSGGHVSLGHAIHEGWAYAVIGSRVAAILSALYLGWRSTLGRRPPAVPPWNRPHKVG